MRRLSLVLLVLACGCAARPTFENASIPADKTTESKTTPSKPVEQHSLTDEDYFRLIHESRGTNSFVNSTRLVRVTNALITQGKAEVLRILRAYITPSDSSADTGFYDFPSPVFWVARLAFTATEGKGLRRPYIGDFGIVVEAESAHWSHYPLCVQEDLPFDLSISHSGTGVPESPTGYLKYVEETGVLRKQALHPADNPLELVERLFESNAWKDIRWEGNEPGHSWFLSEPYLRTVVRIRALEALEDLYDPGEDIWAIESHGGTYDWDKHLARVRALNPRWDAATQRYVSAK